jgi:hypothetical protein
MIIVRFEGGLGNQLFQLSHGIELLRKIGGNLVFDYRPIQGDEGKLSAIEKLTGVYSRGFYNILIVGVLRVYAGLLIRLILFIYGRTDRASFLLARLGVYYQITTRYVELPLPAVWIPFVYLHGNWMSEKYFRDSSDKIRTMIQLDNFIDYEFHSLAQQMKSADSVAVHIRRGDYISDEWRSKLDVCGDRYYQRSVNEISKKLTNPKFFIFTNTYEDQQWIRDNFKFFPDDTVFVAAADSDMVHFSLMTICSHFILANSTFSWWASYISKSPEKIVIAPSIWNRNMWDMQDILLPEWVIIEVE